MARNFPTYFWPRFETFKEEDAFVFVDEDAQLQHENYWAWTRRVRNLAVGFMDRDFEPGIRIALCTKDRSAFFEVAFAAWLIGAVVVPIPTGRDRKETLKRLARCGVGAALLDDTKQYRDLVEEPSKIPPIDWITLETDVEAPLVSLASIIEKGKFRAKRGDLDKLAERTFKIDPSSPALIIHSFESEVYASVFSNAKMSIMMEYLGKSIDWSAERIAFQVDLSWLYGILLGTYALVHGATLIGGSSASGVASKLSLLEPSIIVGGPAYVSIITERWRAESDELSKLVDSVSLPLGGNVSQNWIRALGSNVVGAKVKKSISRDFGEKLNHIFVVDHAVPDGIRDVFAFDRVKVSSIWGRPEIGISHIELTPQKGTVGRPVYGYACKTVGTKNEERGEIAVRSDVIQDRYWGKLGPAEQGKLWIKLPICGRITSGDLVLKHCPNDDEEE